MAYNNTNGCPYLKTYNKVCTHKGLIPNLKKNSCPYKNPMKCRLFKIWLDIVEKESRELKNVKQGHSKEEMR